jgi:hypothetical protein
MATKDDLKMIMEIIKTYQESTDKRFQELIYFTEKRFEEMNKRFDFMFRVSLAFNIPLLISIIAMLLKIFKFI